MYYSKFSLNCTPISMENGYIGCTTASSLHTVHLFRWKAAIFGVPQQAFFTLYTFFVEKQPYLVYHSKVSAPYTPCQWNHSCLSPGVSPLNQNLIDYESIVWLPQALPDWCKRTDYICRKKYCGEYLVVLDVFRDIASRRLDEGGKPILRHGSRIWAGCVRLRTLK